jgi:hypothetical protein
MKKTICFAISTALTLSAIPWIADAHHSFSAEFDSTKPLKMKGTVTKMEWINPHPWIHITVADAKTGIATEWMIEASAPNALLRRGFTKSSLPAGSVIEVEGYQAKDGSNRMNGTDLTFEDGRKLFLGSSGTGAPYDSNPDASK